MKMVKRLIAILMAALILASAAVGVSAAYVDMLDYGLAYGNPRYDNLKYGIGAGESFYTYGSIVPYWALDSFDSDYTYTFSFTFTSDTDLNTSNPNNHVYLSNAKITSLADGNAANVYFGFTKAQLDSGYKYDIVVKLNPGLVELDYFPLYVYALCSVGARTITTNSWSVSAEYDPGGSKYIEDYLADIRDQLHAGDDYTPPDSAASSLDSSVGGLTSAEGALKDKSSSLMDSVDSQMSENVTKAKALVATLKPAAVQINNVYNSFLTVLPDEIKAMFVAIPLLLFVGWLIGRIRE